MTIKPSTYASSHLAYNEQEVIVQLRKAVEILKNKLEESEGGWMISNFLSAAQDKDYWIHEITKAEELSNSYVEVEP